MFYLTYRPKTISELDNVRVKERMLKILESKDLPHAFLLVGPKGMGKTSTARIFAKTVNCLNNKFAGKSNSIEPCNECANCTTIASGGSPDVVEQDAASNRGIDEIKKLIGEASYSPMTGKYRVYIIDEAHMITPDALNALLKTLEEPPKTVIFILATTNEEKIPVTIISRCVKIGFGSAQKADLLHMLKRIVKSENISISDPLLELITNYSENSFRDSSKLLEELITQNKLEVGEAKKYLGIRAKGNILKILEKGNLKEAMVWTTEFVENGGNVKRLIEDTLLTLQSQLVAKSTDDADFHQLDFSLKELSQLIKLFHDAYQMLKISPVAELPLELAIVEFYNGRKRIGNSG